MLLMGKQDEDGEMTIESGVTVSFQRLLRSSTGKVLTRPGSRRNGKKTIGEH